MRILIITGLFLVAGIVIAGCTQQATPAPVTTTAAAPAATVTAGMPNPASEHCVNLGGKLEIKKDAAGGEYGMCTFANGTSCEEWALFRGEGCQAYTATTTTAASTGLANPASEHCVNLGGKLEIKKDAAGGEYGMCTFANGTSCEEWALFRGEGCRAH